MTSKAAFVLGTGRTGSALVHEIVARHPAVGFVTNLDDLGIRRGNSQQLTLWRRLPQVLSEKGRPRLAPSEGARVIAREVSPALVDPAADPTAADLTPWLADRLHRFVANRVDHLESAEVFVHKFTGWPRARLLDAAFPQARYVHLVRDGRAVANSWMHTEWWRGHLGPGGWGFGPLPDDLARAWDHAGRSQPVLAALAWRLLTEAAEECASRVGERWLTVRYEDVVADPRGELARILEHIGLDWSDAFESGFSRYLITGARVEAFRTDLSPDQIAAMETAVAPSLERYHYL